MHDRWSQIYLINDPVYFVAAGYPHDRARIRQSVLCLDIGIDYPLIEFFCPGDYFEVGRHGTSEAAHHSHFRSHGLAKDEQVKSGANESGYGLRVRYDAQLLCY
jgi:hypothetical protein